MCGCQKHKCKCHHCPKKRFECHVVRVIKVFKCRPKRRRHHHCKCDF